MEVPENKSQKLNTQGGGFLLNVQFNHDKLSQWESTLEHQGTLVDFGNTTRRALIPIWELADNPTRAYQLKRVFIELNSAQANKWPEEKLEYVTDIVFVSDADEHTARRKCPPSYHLVEGDLNRGAGGDFIYMCKKFSKNINEAYTDFFMETSKEKKESVESKHNHNGNYVIYKRISNDLNKGAGGKFIYIWTTKSKNKDYPPIKDIDVVFDNPDVNQEWNNVSWQNSKKPADVNKDVKGDYIFIVYKR